jgi:hypothetical protein
MNIETLVTRGAVAFLLGLPIGLLGCGANPAIRIPAAPEQKTSFHPEDPRTYDIHALNGAVADEQQALYESQRKGSVDLACVKEENWEVWSPSEPTVVAIVKGPQLSEQEQRALDETVTYFGTAFSRVEYEYARFQDFRRLYDGASHDPRLLRVTIQQGLTSLYWGRHLLDFASTLESKGCSLKPFRRGLKAVSDIASDVGQGQLPAVMRQLDPASDPWGSQLLRIQLAIFSGQDALSLCAGASRSLSTASTPYDTSILTWCGYAAAQAGQSEQAQTYWSWAGQSVHDPEGASYALARIRDNAEGRVSRDMQIIAIRPE